MSELELRAATLDDLVELKQLEQSIIESERPFDGFLKVKDVVYYDIPFLIADPETNLIVVVSQGQIVGSGYAQLRPSKACHTHDVHCYLGFIFVDVAFRGRGVARLIVESLTQWSAGRDVRHFYLDVYVANASAIRAYEKFGFAQKTVKMELEL